jgi:probable F420-dependent oxidoreductase
MNEAPLAGRPFRFGLSAVRPRPKDEWKALARRLEDAGFHTLVMPDHFGARMAPASALVLAAEATTRLRVGTLVYNNDFRHPAVLAQEVATIDLLTAGRFDLGIGAGWLKSEYDAAGIAFEPGGVRVERLAESLGILKQLFRGSPVTSQGQHYRMSASFSTFSTVQQPHPPIVIGGGGRKLLTLAAREADIVSIMPRSRPDGSGLDETDGGADAFIRKVAVVREAAGERFSQLELNTLVQAVIIGADQRQAVAALSKEYGMSIEAALESPLVLAGTVEQIAESLVRRRHRFGLSYLTFFERDMESAAMVIDHLSK